MLFRSLYFIFFPLCCRRDQGLWKISGAHGWNAVFVVRSSNYLCDNRAENHTGIQDDCLRLPYYLVRDNRNILYLPVKNRLDALV